jgi:hypothetical protein
MSQFEQKLKDFESFELKMKALFQEKAPDKYRDWCLLIFDEAKQTIELAKKEINTLKNSQ